ncbi:MAG: hypothetical protein H6728_00075 [Myxococcales bacterium]|nr:hypothetical protein [Myxococcales bacterium]MCB9641458.1 hypothetical protein [Myxococcales bacterium]
MTHIPSFLILGFGLLLSAPTHAKSTLDKCIQACARRQKQAYQKCLQIYATSPAQKASCPAPQEQPCQVSCQRYVARVREHKRNLCARAYLQRMHHCQDLRTEERTACQQAALQQKKRCLHTCRPAPPSQKTMHCLKSCSQYWSKQRTRCARFRLTPRVRLLCLQRNREEHDRCVHLCENPRFSPFYSDPTTQPSTKPTGAP